MSLRIQGESYNANDVLPPFSASELQTKEMWASGCKIKMINPIIIPRLIPIPKMLISRKGTWGACVCMYVSMSVCESARSKRACLTTHPCTPVTRQNAGLNSREVKQTKKGEDGRTQARAIRHRVRPEGPQVVPYTLAFT